MTGLTPELLDALIVGNELIAEVDRLRAGIQEQIDRSEVAADAWGSGTENTICTMHARELRHLLDPTEGEADADA